MTMLKKFLGIPLYAGVLTILTACTTQSTDVDYSGEVKETTSTESIDHGHHKKSVPFRHLVALSDYMGDVAAFYFHQKTRNDQHSKNHEDGHTFMALSVTFEISSEEGTNGAKRHCVVAMTDKTHPKVCLDEESIVNKKPCNDCLYSDFRSHLGDEMASAMHATSMKANSHNSRTPHKNAHNNYKFRFVYNVWSQSDFSDHNVHCGDQQFVYMIAPDGTETRIRKHTHDDKVELSAKSDSDDYPDHCI